MTVSQVFLREFFEIFKAAILQNNCGKLLLKLAISRYYNEIVMILKRVTHFTLLCIIMKNGQTSLKILGCYTARFSKYIWPVFFILYERVKVMIKVMSFAPFLQLFVNTYKVLACSYEWIVNVMSVDIIKAYRDPKFETLKFQGTFRGSTYSRS